MKSKRLIQIIVVFVLLVGSMGSGQPAFASTDNPTTRWDPMVINRNLDFWDATYIGFVSSSVFEKWHFDFGEPHDFIVTVTPVTGDFTPLLTLLDAGDNQLAQSTGTLTSYQPAGSYSVQVQPQTGSGFYILTIRQVATTSDPTVTTTVDPTSLNVGETALATVALSNVPADGYTSAEFTCTYDPSTVDVSAGDISVGGLFGADAVVAISGPANGSFIVAIAGSNGNKATADGTAFTFNVTGLQAGESAIVCTARVSTGNNVLIEIASSGTSLTVLGSGPTPTPIDTTEPTFTPTPEGSVTPVDTPTPEGSLTPTPVESSTPEGTTTPVDTPTPVESVTPTFTSTPVETPTDTFTPTPADTFTPTPSPDGTVSGQVNAGKPVTINLYDSGDNLVQSVAANSDGTFSLTAPAGTYSIVATASGFLSAEGSITIASDSTTTQPTITLLAGDIDNNDVIDQFDAMTIGINYNASDPAAADLNNDGVINVLDLELLAQNYRMTGPVAWE